MIQILSGIIMKQLIPYVHHCLKRCKCADKILATSKAQSKFKEAAQASPRNGWSGICVLCMRRSVSTLANHTCRESVACLPLITCKYDLDSESNVKANVLLRCALQTF